MARDPHFDRLAELLVLESRAEAEAVRERAARTSPAAAEASGDALVELAVREESFGLGGRFLVRLAKLRGDRLPWTRLDPGAPVVLSSGHGRGRAHRCVVSARDERSIEVALPGEPAELELGEVWRLDLAHDEITVRRQREALERVASAGGTRLAELRAVLLGERAPAQREDEGPFELDDDLDDSQREAARNALAAADVALIHGPPGTGKTRTVVEVIVGAIRRGDKVLAVAPSNTAADNLLERLVARNARVVRLGHPARVLPHLVQHTLDLEVERHEDVRRSRRLVREAWSLRRQADRITRAKPAPGARAELRREARALLADAWKLERQAVRRVLDEADVVCGTASLDEELLGDRTFGLVVLDEACQTTEPGAWVPICRASGAIVLAGDHLQLAPTILSREAATRGLGVSLFERLIGPQRGPATVPVTPRPASPPGDLSPFTVTSRPTDGPRTVPCGHGRGLSRMLTTQYRMNEVIMRFSSRELYEDRLIAAPAVEGHLLAELPGVARSPRTTSPLELIDTAGGGLGEELEEGGESRLNPGEAKLVLAEVEALLRDGVRPGMIAVIAPYSAQVRHLRAVLANAARERADRGQGASEGSAADPLEVEVDTVDGFQGREKEVVIISLVRSNDRAEVGFLEEIRRMNVALTRARRRLVVIGDGATLGAHPFYERLLAYAEERGAYRTIWETPLE